MPLEALYFLMQEFVKNAKTNRHVLVGESSFTTGQNIQLVTRQHFQSASLGIDPSTVTDYLLGFFTLLMSYAKAAALKQDTGVSPKHWLTFMPRTDFNTIYAQVSSKLKKNLFGIMNILACYTTDQNQEVK